MPNYWILCFLFFELCACIESPWKWECVNNTCLKQRVDPTANEPITSLGVCQLQCCQYGTIWPKPTGIVTIGKTLVVIDPNRIDVLCKRSSNDGLIPAGIRNFIAQVQERTKSKSTPDDAKSLIVQLNITKPEVNQLTLHLDESYELRIVQADSETLIAAISADNYFGSRHALETLGQLIVHDEIFNNLKVPTDVLITDKPVYTYRGVLLDTSRNYISVDAIKRTIAGMSLAKLNTFHWHITDTHSFPYVSPSHPELSGLGAYSPSQVYRPEDVAEVLRFGLERGVRILPEFDAPAHVGEGWQDTDYVVCFDKQPWEEYCVEPPCGQFDPTKEGLYDVLEDLYHDFVTQFNPDMFHMGGDEVAFECWNSTTHITDWMKKKGWKTDTEGFVKLWSHFQDRALERLDKQTDRKLPVVLWSTTLNKREFVEKNLPKDRYIVQIWTTADDHQIQDLLELGYSLILSNYDALYLDCGVAGWVASGSNWCSPYKGWHLIYENSPAVIGGKYWKQFLGGEAALWTEQVDDAAVDSRIWPRASAMAERLWSEPETGWREAEARMLIHRQRLVNRGIQADALEPQWCVQNQKSCPKPAEN